MCTESASAVIEPADKDAVGPQAKSGRRRLKIWELPASYHCPIVGVCLPLAVLRRLVNKAVNGEAYAGDYEIHVGAVNDCIGKGRLSKLIQEELDRRYVQTIHQMRNAGTPTAVFAHWRAAEAGGDVAGALWACLTHPNSDSFIREEICKSMHMIQHQAGARSRIEHGRFEALANEHRVLTTELGKIQARCTALLDEKNAEIGQLRKQLQEARGAIIRKDTEIAALHDEMAELPGLPLRIELKRRVAELTGHLQQRNRALLQAQREMETVRETMRETAREAGREAAADHPDQGGLPDMAQHEVETGEAAKAANLFEPVVLDSKTVLCVGGRTNVVSRYRDCVENFGAHFSHHDGGVEDSMGQLDSTLAAADLVICQTGCISHSAYWRVKDHCKRTGKRCVFVDKPSTTSFSRILLKITGEDDKED